MQILFYYHSVSNLMFLKALDFSSFIIQKESDTTPIPCYADLTNEYPDVLGWK